MTRKHRTSGLVVAVSGAILSSGTFAQAADFTHRFSFGFATSVEAPSVSVLDDGVRIEFDSGAGIHVTDSAPRPKPFPPDHAAFRIGGGTGSAGPRGDDECEASAGFIGCD